MDILHQHSAVRLPADPGSACVQDLQAPAPPPSNHSLTLQTAADFESIAGIEQEWDHAVERLGGPIYMTYDWLRIWWKFYGRGKRLLLLLFRHEGRLVALLPLFLESFGLGPWRTTVARLAGSNVPPKAFNPPVDVSWAPLVFKEMLKELFMGNRCDLLSLGPVSSRWEPAAALEQACAAGSDRVAKAKHLPFDVQTVFHLPATFEEYLQGLSPTERKNRLKRLRQLERNHRVSSDVVSEHGRIEEEFERFARLHAQQWQAAGKGGHFEAWPRAAEFNRELVQAQARHGRVRFFRLLIDGEVVSNRYTFLFGNTLFSELPARAVGAPWDKLGIGGSSMVKFNEAAIQEGISRVDSGLGGYDHKMQLGGEQIPVGVWHVTGQRLASRIKAGILLILAKFIKLVFHKVWYRRIAPLLPASVGRTQRLFWIRFDA